MAESWMEGWEEAPMLVFDWGKEEEEEEEEEEELFLAVL